MRLLSVHNPVTGEPVGQVPVTAPETIRALAQSARQAQVGWAARPIRERQQVLLRFHDLILNRDTEILDTIQAETGKSRRDAFTEVLSVAGTARYYAFHGPRHVRDRRHRAAIPGLTHASTRWVPHALVGLITPWNYPFLLAVADALPALLGGSAVLVKPSERTPLSGELARKLLIESGLDPLLFGLIHGDRSEAMELIREVDYLAFTGGAAAGLEVSQAVGDRMIDCSLELGGKNAMIVDQGTRIPQSVNALVAGAYLNSGQACISIERVYVVSSLYDAFLEAARRRIACLRLGWSQDWSVDMGSLISTRHADSVLRHVASAVAAGARVAVGGKRREDLGPAFVEPTLLTDLDPAVPVASEEAFGPVVSVFRVRDGTEAVQAANSSSLGLNASVWGHRARQLAREIEAGSVGVNSALEIYASLDVPMGGIRGSGRGRRHGAEGIRRFGTTRSLVIGPAAGGGYDALWLHLTDSRRVRLMKDLYRVWRRLPGLR